MVPRAKAGDLDGALVAALERIDKAVVPGGNPGHRLAGTLFLIVGGLIGLAGAGHGRVLRR